MRSLGFEPEDYGPPPEFDLWPENVTAWQLYYENRTQWRMGPVGPSGLDYNVIDRALDRMDLDDDDHADMKWAIRQIEMAALEVLHEKNS